VTTVGDRAGLPTANVEVPRRSACLPSDLCRLVRTPGGSRWATAISVGRRPTFYGSDGELLVEAFLLDFDGDLYGEEASVSFVARLRDELAFDSVDDLVAQMNLDVAKTRVELATKS